MLSGMKGMGLSCFGEVRAGTETWIRPPWLRPVSIPWRWAFSPWTVLFSGPWDEGRPERTIRGALALKEAGVEPVVDMILGLPGDTPEGIIAAGERLRSLGLGESLHSSTFRFFRAQ